MDGWMDGAKPSYFMVIDQTSTFVCIIIPLQFSPMSGNTFGKLFTVTTFGESYGPAIGCVVDAMLQMLYGRYVG